MARAISKTAGVDGRTSTDRHPGFIKFVHAGLEDAFERTIMNTAIATVKLRIADPVSVFWWCAMC